MVVKQKIYTFLEIDRKIEIWIDRWVNRGIDR